MFSAFIGTVIGIIKKLFGVSIDSPKSSILFVKVNSDRLVVDADTLQIPFVQSVDSFVYLYLMMPAQSM